jgi:multidrug efflux pump subunit AcrA (membrane-fusion protein)
MGDFLHPAVRPKPKKSDESSGSLRLPHGIARIINTLLEVGRLVGPYRVEIEAPNPGGRARAGLSAEVRINTGSGPAHLVPTTTLVLDSAGRQGVRYIIAGDRVAFAPVTVLDETPEGVWISGLSGDARVITAGQSYVSEGQKVRIPAK